MSDQELKAAREVLVKWDACGQNLIESKYRERRLADSLRTALAEVDRLTAERERLAPKASEEEQSKAGAHCLNCGTWLGTYWELP